MCDDIIHKRFAVAAPGAPALVVALQLDEIQATQLLQWYNNREKELKSQAWVGWNPAYMALRTICVQIETYGKQAYRREPGWFGISLPSI